MKPHLLVMLATTVLAQCSPAASQAPQPSAPAEPARGFVEIRRPPRVIPVEGEEGERKSVFAQPTVANGTALTINTVSVDCELSNGARLLGDLDKPLAPGASVIVPALMSQMADALDIDEAFLPTIQSCGATKVVAAGGRELVVTDGIPLPKIAEADLKAPEQGPVQ